MRAVEGDDSLDPVDIPAGLPTAAVSVDLEIMMVEPFSEPGQSSVLSNARGAGGGLEQALFQVIPEAVDDDAVLCHGVAVAYCDGVVL